MTYAHTLVSQSELGQKFKFNRVSIPYEILYFPLNLEVPIVSLLFFKTCIKSYKNNKNTDYYV